MCNNIRMNQLRKDEKKEVVKDKISDWQEYRPILKKNILAKERRILGENIIEYEVGYSLKLHDKTRILKIYEQKVNDEYKDFVIEFSFYKSNKINTTKFRRYSTDTLDDIERFLENSQSIFQIRNIDLNYK